MLLPNFKSKGSNLTIPSKNREATDNWQLQLLSLKDTSLVLLPEKDENEAVTISKGLKNKKKAFRFMNYIADTKEFSECVEVKVLNEYLEALKDELKLLQQKAKIKWLSKGDQNTSYVHGILKSKKHKGIIKSICDENDTRYNGDKVAEAFVDDFKKFLDDEIKEVIFKIDSNEASDPDGYTSRFLKKAWNSIGKESAFIPGRHIEDNILIAHKLLKGYKRKNGARRYALKIDIQKAYDTVNWDFL
nr:hypothetical protein [Tanacetum cinerariifolium]